MITADQIDGVLRERLIRDPAFQDAAQRYAHGNGSSAAIADAVLTACGFWQQRSALRAAAHALRSYEFGNASPDLARSIAGSAERALNGDAA